MARYTLASCKRCRKLGTKLFLKGTKCYTSCIFEKRAPTKQKSFRSKPTEYSIRLSEKQRAKTMAGMTEQPFQNLFYKASKTKGKTGEMFLRFLETRLDNIVRRLGFAVSLKAARQLVLHGHIKVNDRMINVASYQVRIGDKISISPKAAQTVLVKQGLETTEKRSLRPSFVEFDAQTASGKLLRWPDRGEMSYPVKEQLIVEYYSK